MANRRFEQFNYTLEKSVRNLFLKATIGAAGAVTLDAVNSRGIASVVKLATAGQYRITLQDQYRKLLGLDAVVQNATGIPASAAIGILTSGTAVGAVGGGTIVIQFSNGGAATNLASGDVVYAMIILGDSSV